MTLSNAQEQFKIRHYLWAISEFEREINDLFPNLRSFKAGYGWEVFQFMQTLSREEQIVLAHALLRKWHSDAAKALGETISAEEHFLLVKCRIFVMELSMKVDAEITAKRRVGEKIKFASKVKLQKVVSAKFKEVYGGQIIGEAVDSQYDPVSLFTMKFCGWVVNTQFWFGRRESLIEYQHSIESPTRIHHPHNPGISGPAMQLEQCISWLYFRQIKHLSSDEVDLGCSTVIKFCQYFLDVAPKLLKGLEFEKITGQ